MGARAHESDVGSKQCMKPYEHMLTHIRYDHRKMVHAQCNAGIKLTNINICKNMITVRWGFILRNHERQESLMGIY